MASLMPSDRPWSSAGLVFSSAISVLFHLNNKLASAIIECARENNITVANLCLACHFAFLIELTGEYDLGVVCTMAGRPLEPEAANILGPFADYNVIRVTLDKKTNPTFITLIKQTHAVMTESFDHLFAEQDPLTFELAECMGGIQPISSFQFDEKLRDITLDKNVRLHCLDPSDNMSIPAWWSVAALHPFSSVVTYDQESAEFSYVFEFSTVFYERPTAVRIIK
ncbi:unnamed protein product [Rotaria sp. Silwood2]|nr:unnamed protein product [Rotaria sp. Silwood2]